MINQIMLPFTFTRSPTIKSNSDLSGDESAFNNAKVTYESVLKHSGYKREMKFDRQPSTRRNRNRKISLKNQFNPPFSQNVRLTLENFFSNQCAKNHRFRKIFNLNTLKLSYCSVANLQSLIKQHNAKVLTDGKKSTRLCNCRYKDSCPLAGKCIAKCIVYKAEVTTTDKRKLHYGTTGGEFKFRFKNHTRSFRDKRYSTDSKYIWNLSNDKIQYEIKWNIAEYASQM